MNRYCIEQALVRTAALRMKDNARHRRQKRTRGMHQDGRDLLAKLLKALPHAERSAAHDAFDISLYRFDTTNYPEPRSNFCLKFALMVGSGAWWPKGAR